MKHFGRLFMVIETKRGRKLLLRVGAVLVTTVAVACFSIRLVPALLSNQNNTALTAAGFIMPDGAVEVMKNGYDDAYFSVSEVEEMVSQASSVPEITESTVTSEETVGQSSSEAYVPPEPDYTVYEGTAYPINEMQIANVGLKYENITVRNDTDYELDIAQELGLSPDVKIKKDGTPQVLIYHTHTGESFLKTEMPNFYSSLDTRSRDENLNVIAVGNEITKKLEEAGIGVIHDTTIHDDPYTGAYNRSWETIQRNLNENPTIQVTIDVHRDALGGESTRIKPTTVINGRKAAQIMILSGYDGDGSLGFPDWELNLRLALRLQQNCANIEQSFIRPLNFTNSRYNMNATHGSLLVEFGTEVNTIDEVKYSGQLFRDALVKTLESLM